MVTRQGMGTRLLFMYRLLWENILIFQSFLFIITLFICSWKNFGDLLPDLYNLEKKRRYGWWEMPSRFCYSSVPNSRVSERFKWIFPLEKTRQLVSGLSHVGHFKMAAPLVGSQLFSPFRALGFVANHVPLTLQTQGTETLVTTAVGSAFHVYSVSIF